jgi:hypothetical protein
MDVVRPARESMSALKMPPPMARVKSLIIQRALKGVKKKLDGKSPVTTGRRLGHGQWNTALLRAMEKMLNKRHVVRLTGL